MVVVVVVVVIVAFSSLCTSLGTQTSGGASWRALNAMTAKTSEVNVAIDCDRNVKRRSSASAASVAPEAAACKARTDLGLREGDMAAKSRARASWADAMRRCTRYAILMSHLADPALRAQMSMEGGSRSALSPI